MDRAERETELVLKQKQKQNINNNKTKTKTKPCHGITLDWAYLIAIRKL